MKAGNRISSPREEIGLPTSHELNGVVGEDFCLEWKFDGDPRPDVSCDSGSLLIQFIRPGDLTIGGELTVEREVLHYGAGLNFRFVLEAVEELGRFSPLLVKGSERTCTDDCNGVVELHLILKLIIFCARLNQY